MDSKSPLNSRVIIIILLILGFFIYLAISQGWLKSLTSGETFSTIEEWFEEEPKAFFEEKFEEPKKEETRPSIEDFFDSKEEAPMMRPMAI